MKNILFSIVTGLLVLVSAPVVMADGSTSTEEVCTTNQYGETTCKKTTKTGEVVVHEPIDTAIGDINPAVLSMILFAGALASYKLSVKVK